MPESVNPFLEHFKRMQLDPEAVSSSLGKPYDTVTPETLLDATNKVLKLSKREVDPDDRDSMEFQTIHDTGDFISDKVRMDQNGVLKKTLWKLTNKPDNMAKIPSGLLDKHIDTLFNGSGVTQLVEAINPMDMYDQNKRVVRMGEGALPSLESVPKEARAVNPSQMLLIDPIRAPECFSEDMEIMTDKGWLSVRDVTDDTILACLINNKLVYHLPEKVHKYAYNGDMIGAKTDTMDFLVTPNHRMWVRPYECPGKSTYRFEEAKELLKKNRLMQIASFDAIEYPTTPFFSVPSVEGQPTTEPHTIKEFAYADSFKNTQKDIPYKLWLSFLGWYLSKGSFVWDTQNGCYRVDISQSKTGNPDKYMEMKEVIEQLPFAVSYDDRGAHITGKQLVSYVRQFGDSCDKFIPDYVFTSSVAEREQFVQAILQGDGRKNKKNGTSALCTSSKQLALDMQRLLFTLGKSSYISFEKEKREKFAHCPGCYVVNTHTRNERLICYKTTKHSKGQVYTKQYVGTVYCVTVPGSLVYVRRNGNQGFWCGNSLKVGVDSRFARNVKRGPDNLVYTKVRDFKTKKEVWVSSKDLPKSVIAFTGASDSVDEFVPAIVRGKSMEYAPKKDIQYEAINGDDMFNDFSNITPMKSGVKGMRLLMGSKYVSFALPLKDRQYPLVTTLEPDGTATQDKFDKFLGAVKSDIDGTVTKVTNDAIVIQQADGTKVTKDLYNNHPFARKTAITQTATVNPGDKIKAGDLLATSNFTDKAGKFALGTNLKIGYYMADGNLFEDSVVISESASKRMTSDHMYKEAIDTDGGVELSKTKFTQLFPGKFTKEQIANLDDRGIVKPGITLQPGDPMFIGVKETPPGPGNMGRGSTRQFVVTWDHDYAGLVTDTAKNKRGFSTYVKTESPMTVGDKLACAFGAKGVVAKILPDDQMPRDAAGKPLELLLNPMGIASRTNSAIILAAALGKVAEKTGKPYKLPGFSDDSLVTFVKQELAKNNMTDRETVFDPQKSVNVPDVFVGNAYWYKMQQTAESKGKSRSVAGYTQEDIPVGKHMGDMEWSALLGHHATNIIRDLKLYKGRRNDDFWRQLKLGQTPSIPTTPLVYDKFKNLLKGAGINLSEDKNTSRIFGMTNKQAEELTKNNRLESADTYSATSFKPLPGGLFDPEKTGADTDGKTWAYYDLPEPLPNPVMEEPIRALLGVTKKDFDKIISGETPLNGKYGGEAMIDALKRVNLSDVIAQAQNTIKSGAASKKDAAIKVLKYAAAMQKQNVRPEDFMMTRVPVLPPTFRPITASGSRTMVADMNYMYKALFESMQDFKEAKETLPKDLQSEARLNMHNAYRAVVGISDPTQEKLAEKRIGGILDQLLSKGSPKTSFVQRRLIGTNIDVYGLNAISLNPSLKINQVGIPEAEAWDVYSPFITRKLVQQGVPAVEAVKAIKAQDEKATKALQAVIKERPVIVNRAPTLHKYSMMALWPVLTKGHSLQVPPAICAPFTADFDGDTMSWSVPVSDAAVKEAVDKMMPDKNLLSIASDRPLYIPSQEYTMGAYFLSKEPAKEPVKTFKNWTEAVQAYRKGQLRVDTPVKIG